MKVLVFTACIFLLNFPKIGFANVPLASSSGTVSLHIEPFSSVTMAPSVVGTDPTSGGLIITPNTTPNSSIPFYINAVEFDNNIRTMLTCPKQFALQIDKNHSIPVHMTVAGEGFTLTQDVTNWYLHLKAGKYGKNPPGPYIRLIATPDMKNQGLHFKSGGVPVFVVDRNSLLAAKANWQRSVAAGAMSKIAAGPFKYTWTFKQKYVIPSWMIDQFVSNIVRLSPES